jgi:hypothetical protein
MIKISNETATRFYIATNHDEAFSSWATIESARECLERFKTKAPEDYEHIIGIIETPANAPGGYIFHAKGIKPIERIPTGMKDGYDVYVIINYDQGFHFYLISERLWVESQNTLKNICEVIDKLFPPQEDDIADEPEVTEHVRYFSHLHNLLDFVKEHHMRIVSSNEQV